MSGRSPPYRWLPLLLLGLAASARAASPGPPPVADPVGRAAAGALPPPGDHPCAAPPRSAARSRRSSQEERTATAQRAARERSESPADPPRAAARSRRSIRKNAATTGKSSATAQRAARKRDATRDRGGAQRRAARRTRQARRRSNLPDGWTWPPSAAMQRQGRLCLRELDRLGVQWRRMRGRPRIATPIEIPAMKLGDIALQPTFRKPPFVMDCHLALALRRHSDALRALGVTALRFSTIHEYRRVRLGGSVRRPLSRHALGLAVDVFFFVDQDGGVHEVARDYHAENGLLRRIEAALNATGGFRMLLTPGNEPSHHDHFHLEAKVHPLPEPAASRQRSRRSR